MSFPVRIDPLPDARPAGGFWPSRRAILPACRTGFEPSHSSSDKAKGPVLRRGLLLYLAVREGFEPSIRCRIHTFQACSFSHSDTSPNFYFLKWLSEHAARASCRLRRWAASRSPHQIFVCSLTCSANTSPLRRCAGTGRNVGESPAAVNGFLAAANRSHIKRTNQCTDSGATWISGRFRKPRRSHSATTS